MTSLTIRFSIVVLKVLNILLTSTVTFKFQRILKKIIMIVKILCHRGKNCICMCLKKTGHKVDPIDDPQIIS